mmetsp:Transcript_45571/g.105704  ORF Transcript_45571/g.105704 Transcript_45571/m.105704 type:complete len:250 (-) Transcript_45571:709-1458(-)
MPMSIFRTVKLLKKINTRKANTKKSECLPMSSALFAGLSSKVPCKRSSSIASATDGMISSSSALPPTCILKTTPKRKSRQKSSNIVTKTDRVAHMIPLRSVRASGTNRTSAAILPKRTRRMRRTMRTTDKPEEEPSPPSPSVTTKITAAKIQVSITMMTTRSASKQNHLSCKQSRFRWYAAYRTESSRRKAKQNAQSMTQGVESKPTLERSAKSAWTAIQTVFKNTITIDENWNKWLLAMRAATLSFLE